eukprot:COSAG01_NODE_7182_length_3316_cov_2.184955_2_plen_163_part_00
MSIDSRSGDTNPSIDIPACTPASSAGTSDGFDPQASILRGVTEPFTPIPAAAASPAPPGAVDATAAAAAAADTSLTAQDGAWIGGVTLLALVALALTLTLRSKWISLARTERWDLRGSEGRNSVPWPWRQDIATTMVTIMHRRPKAEAFEPLPQLDMCDEGR